MVSMKAASTTIDDLRRALGAISSAVAFLNHAILGDSHSLALRNRSRPSQPSTGEKALPGIHPLGVVLRHYMNLYSMTDSALLESSARSAFLHTLLRIPFPITYSGRLPNITPTGNHFLNLFFGSSPSLFQSGSILINSEQRKLYRAFTRNKNYWPCDLVSRFMCVHRHFRRKDETLRKGLDVGWTNEKTPHYVPIGATTCMLTPRLLAAVLDAQEKDVVDFLCSLGVPVTPFPNGFSYFNIWNLELALARKAWPDLDDDALITRMRRLHKLFRPYLGSEAPFKLLGLFSVLLDKRFLAGIYRRYKETGNEKQKELPETESARQPRPQHRSEKVRGGPVPPHCRASDPSAGNQRPGTTTGCDTPPAPGIPARKHRRSPGKVRLERAEDAAGDGGNRQE